MKHKHALVFEGLANNKPISSFEITHVSKVDIDRWDILRLEDLKHLCSSPEEFVTRERVTMLAINGKSFPEPLQARPATGVGHYVASPTGVFCKTWDNDDDDYRNLVAGLCHLERSAALAQAHAICCAVGGTYTAG